MLFHFILLVSGLESLKTWALALTVGVAARRLFTCKFVTGVVVPIPTLPPAGCKT